jgi:hypothetical protein
MQIECADAEWGKGARPILEDAASHLLRHFTSPPQGRIRVLYEPAALTPRTFYRNSPDDDFVVRLNANAILWSKLAYQFSHELLHIASNFESLSLHANGWFEETLAELASIFVLKQMAKDWRKSPTNGWPEYAAEHDKYAEELLTRAEYQLPTGQNLSQWFTPHEATLRTDRYQRALNGVVAVQLFPLFQNSPSNWQCVRYLPNSDASFAEYLPQWRAACPPVCSQFVADIGRQFGIQAA